MTQEAPCCSLSYVEAMRAYVPDARLCSAKDVDSETMARIRDISHHLFGSVTFAIPVSLDFGGTVRFDWRMGKMPRVVKAEWCVNWNNEAAMDYMREHVFDQDLRVERTIDLPVFCPTPKMALAEVGPKLARWQAKLRAHAPCASIIGAVS